MAIELTPEIRALLEGPNVAHLATRRPDGDPAVQPVWVGLDDGGRILVCTGRGTAKVRNAEHHPHVALSVLAHDNPYDELMVRGTVVEIRDDIDNADMDVISHVYTGKPFPIRGRDRVTIVIEPTWARHTVLPFTPA